MLPFLGARDATEGASTDSSKNYEHDGKNYIYTDETTKLTYKFDEEKKEWVLKAKENELSAESVSEHISGPITATPNAIYGFENDTHTYTDPSDGSVYMWDREKNAWFPKVHLSDCYFFYTFTFTSLFCDVVHII